MLPLVKLICGQHNTIVEGDLVELAQKHVGDYANKWKEQLQLHGQSDKFWDWDFKREQRDLVRSDKKGAIAKNYDLSTK